MTMYRSKRSGKTYRAVEWPDAHLGIIMVKDNMAAPEHRDYKIGPFGSPEDAEGALRDKAQRFNWEEISND